MSSYRDISGIGHRRGESRRRHRGGGITANNVKISGDSADNGAGVVSIGIAGGAGVQTN